MTSTGTRIAAATESRFRTPWPEIGLIAVLLSAYATAAPGINSALVWSCLSLHYAMLLASLWHPSRVWRGKPTYISIEFLFLFFSYLIYFYPYQLHVLNIANISRSGFIQGYTFTDQSNSAILIASIGMLAFRGGIRALALSDPAPDTTGQNRRHENATGPLDRLSPNTVALPVFFLQALLISGYLAAGWKAIGEGRYSGETSTNSVAEGVYLLIVILSMVSFALLVYPAAERSVFIPLSALLSALWAVRILLNGDRNSFLLIAIVAIGGLFTFRISAGRWSLLVLGVSALSLYNAVEALRRGDVGSLFDFYLGDNVATNSHDGDTSFNNTTIGMRAALAGVPQYIDYGYGLYKLIGLAGVVPLIRGFVIPSDAPFKASSDVINDIVLGGPSAGWSLGTSVIADVYVDFGVVGVPLLLFSLGIFGSYVQHALTVRPASVWRAVLYLMTLALFAEIPRYAFVFPVRPIFWTFLLFFAITLFSRSRAGSGKSDTS